MHQVAVTYDRGRVDSKWIAMAEISACRAAVAVSSEAVQLMGGYGYASEYEVERFYRVVTDFRLNEPLITVSKKQGEKYE